MSKLLAAAALSAAFLVPAPASAIENFTWSTPTGLLFFGSGFLPPTTDVGTFGLRTVGASADSLYDQSGRKVPNEFNLSVNVTTPSYIKMTNLTILGARYGFLIVQPIFTFNGGLHVPTPHGPISLHQATTGLGNTTIDPFILAWDLPNNVHINTGLVIQPNNGYYRKTGLFNPSTNYWTFGPHAAITYISPYGQEVSAMTEVDFNTRNNATKYTSGTEFKLEWAVGQHLGNFTVGPAGYVYQQLERDTAPTLTTKVKSRVFAAGLSVNYLERGSPYFLQATILREFGAVSHLQGTVGMLRAGLTF